MQTGDSFLKVARKKLLADRRVLSGSQRWEAKKLFYRFKAVLDSLLNADCPGISHVSAYVAITSDVAIHFVTKKSTVYLELLITDHVQLFATFGYERFFADAAFIDYGALVREINARLGLSWTGG